MPRPTAAAAGSTVADAVRVQQKAARALQQQQAQRSREFDQHKESILRNISSSSACDLSPKGSIDAKCRSLMDVLNTHPDYVTTSSCSGRIALFHSIHDAAAASGGGEDGASHKRGAAAALGWVLVKHGLLRAAEAQRLVAFLCGAAQPGSAAAALDAAEVAAWAQAEEAVDAAEEAAGVPAALRAYGGELEGLLARADADAAAAVAVPARGTLSLKMEPFVMHVACRTMDGAKLLHAAAASDSGYRNSGVVPPGKRIMCCVRTTAGLGMEVPLVLDGCNHAWDDTGRQARAYVWALARLANQKMGDNEEKAKLLERCVVSRLRKAAELNE